MTRMSFKLEMDRPIIEGTHYISPGGYCLRFSTLNGVKEVQFDFLNSEYSIVDERYLDYTVYGLDTGSFKDSINLVSLLRNRNYEWGEFFVYTGEYDDAEINPVRAFDIVIEKGSSSYKMKDYVFSEAKNYFSPELFGVMKSIMVRAVKFCTSRQMLVKGGGLRFFENDGNVFLCTKMGNGYCYNPSDGSVTTTGFFGSKDSLMSVKGIIEAVLNDLTEKISFSVKSIVIPYGSVKGCYYKESTSEPGSYDIIFE